MRRGMGHGIAAGVGLKGSTARGRLTTTLSPPTGSEGDEPPPDEWPRVSPPAG